MSARPTEEVGGDPSGIRVAVSDDEETVVDVLRALIGSDPSLVFVGAARDADHAIELVAREKPDVLLLDVRMPGGGGLRALREIKERFPSTNVVALSAHEDADTVISMIGAGARSYVPKIEPTEKILREIHRAVDPTWSSPPETSSRSAAKPAVPPRVDQRSQLARAIIDDTIEAEFEPIVEVATGRVVGLEILPRVVTLPHRPYDAWMAEAVAAGLLTDLETAALRAGLNVLEEIPDDIFLEFEVSPTTARSESLRRAVRRPIAGRLVLGLTPCDTVDGSGSAAVELRSALAILRQRGVRFSARDLGPGAEGLRHLAFLSPEFARLDPTLTCLLDHSTSTHAMVAAATKLAAEAGAEVIATTVEDRRRLEELDRLGVHLAQGPLMGEPVQRSELRADPRWIAGWGSSAGAPPPMPSMR